MNKEEILSFSKYFSQYSPLPPTLLIVLEPTDSSPSGKIQITSNQIRKIWGDQELLIKTRKGLLVEESISEIQEGDYDIFVVGNPSPKRLGHIFIHATTRKLIKQAICSVLIVQGEVRPIRKILLCDSGLDESPLLRKFISYFIDSLDGEEEVTVLHVMSQISAGPGVRGQQLRANTDEHIETRSPEGTLLERDVHFLEKSGLHPVPKVRPGIVVDEILAEARDGNYDLVVIGSKHQKWQRFLLDDLVFQIIDNCFIICDVGL